MVDAIIATEDQSFWENNGTDMSSLARAIWNNISSLRSDNQLQGGSTITQQLIKNVFLSKQKTVSRKFQELILARHLTQTRKNRMQKDFKLSHSAAYKKAKEEIMASYLNVVYFWNHAYGIESAAQNYFGTSAQYLNLLQSSILASLPQAPSIYNPVQDPKPVLWYRNYYHGEDFWELWLYQTWAKIIVDALQQKSLTLWDECLSDLEQWANFQTGWWTANYQRGRKDRVLCRMYELKLIDIDQLKAGFLDGQTLKFSSPRLSIKAPHFVFWLQRYLLQLPEFKGYDEQSLARAGFQIISSLDFQKQQQAEDAITNYMGSLNRLGGNNRSMLHVNPDNGEVLSYVGSADYFDPTILGQNDMIQSPRQIWSTMKPFLYAYLFQHYNFAIDGPIIDAPITRQRINNFDYQFRGKISFAQALASSRNLPVVRIYYALWWDKIFIPYLESLGFHLSGTQINGYPLALGANNASMIELAQAYMQLATTGDRSITINPILSVLTHQWEGKYEKKNLSIPKIINPTVADMLWKILSDANYMPETWYRLHNLPIKNLAIKTGTTDKKVWNNLFPRDGRSVVYNAHDMILSRAGNTDGKEMWGKAFWWEINHYVLRQYLGDMVHSGTIIDLARNEQLLEYDSEAFYAKADHKEINEDISNWFWKAGGVIPKQETVPSVYEELDSLSDVDDGSLQDNTTGMIHDDTIQIIWNNTFTGSWMQLDTSISDKEPYKWPKAGVIHVLP